jgi:hypothetical protein
VHTRDLSTTGDNKPSDVMAALTDTYLAVEAKKLPPSAFAQSVEAVDWQTMDIEDLVAVMRMALQQQMVPLMRKLIAQATPEQMEDPRMQKFFRMVAKRGMAFVRHDPPNPKIEAAHQWYKENAHKYIGKWIAVDGDTMLGVAESRQELMELIGERPAGSLITHVS